MSIKTSKTMSEKTCFEVGCMNKVPIAVWDDNALSGKLVVICYECHEDVPEFNLWDASKIEEDDPPYSDDEKVSHPIPEDQDYVVIENKESNQVENESEDLPDEFTSEEQRFDIYIRDPDDTELLNEAREEVRQRSSS